MVRLGACAAILIGFAVPAGAAAPERDGAAGASIVAAVQAGGQGISTQDEGSDNPTLVWASWTEGTPDHLTTRLVLIRRDPGGATIVWGVQRPDGYGAVLRRPGWQRQGHPVLILQYQFGAAYTRMEFYVVGADGQVSMLGHLEGSLIALERRGVRETLRAFDDASLRGRQRCFTWQEATGKLVPLPCRPTELEQIP